MAMPSYDIVLLGPKGVGKSALSILFVTNTFAQGSITSEDHQHESVYTVRAMVDGVRAHMRILDTTACDSRPDDDWLQFGRGFMLVYDITSRSSFDKMATLWARVLASRGDMASTRVPVVLIGNKFDLAHVARDVDAEAGEELGYTMDVPWFEVSAKWRVNSSTCFHQMVREIRSLDPDFETAHALAPTVPHGPARGWKSATKDEEVAPDARTKSTVRRLWSSGRKRRLSETPARDATDAPLDSATETNPVRTGLCSIQ